MNKRNHDKIIIGSILAACILILIGLSPVLTAKPVSIFEEKDEPTPDIYHFRGLIWGRIEDPSIVSVLNNFYLRFYAVNTYFFGIVTNSDSFDWHFMKLEESYYELGYINDFKGIFTKRLIFGFYNGT